MIFKNRLARQKMVAVSPQSWEHASILLLGLLLAAAGIQAQQIPPGGQRATGASQTRQYPSPSTVGDATITIDPETRTIIVVTDEQTGEHVSQVITNLDRPQPQVLINVVFLEVTYRNSLDFGIEGGATHNVDGATGAGAQVLGLSGLGNSATGAVLNALGIPIQSFAPIPPGAGLYQVIGNNYQATLRAIAQAGKMEVLSRPSILARNNQQAVITVGQSVPLITNVRFDTFGNAINSVQYQNVGIILRVTPFITSENLVEMIVSPEISSLSEQSIPIATGASAPIINLRSADTVVVTLDGQTVIIGGLMQNDKRQTENKIPLLGDIPLLGNLFKRKIKDTTKTELLIFLTPHIVREPAGLALLNTPERTKLELAPKAFSEEELNRFLEGVPLKPESKSGKNRK